LQTGEVLRYSIKTVGIARALGLERYVRDVASLTAGDLTAAMDEVWRGRAEIAARLRQAAGALRRRVDADADALAALARGD